MPHRASPGSGLAHSQPGLAVLVGVNLGVAAMFDTRFLVPDQAQVPAGWALYKDLPTYPNFEGGIGLLAEGISTWLGSPDGWVEDDMAMVVNNGDGTCDVMNPRTMEMITIDHPIPLASAVIW